MPPNMETDQPADSGPRLARAPDSHTHMYYILLKLKYGLDCAEVVIMYFWREVHHVWSWYHMIKLTLFYKYARFCFKTCLHTCSLYFITMHVCHKTETGWWQHIANWLIKKVIWFHAKANSIEFYPSSLMY